MDCPLIQPELVGYHFATTSDDMRAEIDAHLLGCPKCLRAYLGIKHHIERGAAREERPSAAARDRLRAAVAVSFRSTPRARVRRWLGRPIPLYQGLAAALVAVAVAALVPMVIRETAELRTAAGENTDTSRPSPESLAFY
jgi:hypothetical protein